MPPILCMKKLFRLLSVCFACWLCSCASTQRITVKQEQEGQTQETVIESDTRFDAISLYITPDKIDYNASSSLLSYTR